MGKNLGKIIFLNAVGLTIFFSWYLPAEHGFWFTLDRKIFQSEARKNRQNAAFPAR